MTLPDGYWAAAAADTVAAYQECFPAAGGAAERLPSRNAILLAMSVAEHETSFGRAWPGQNNLGAVQLRGLTLQELAAYDAGTLKVGDYTPERTGCLRIDTHPGPSGPVPYPEWFAAFPTRAQGIAHFLRVLWRLSLGAADAVDCTPFRLADAMYQGGYYEGAHHGARPAGKRAYPLTAPEQANVTDYANAIAACMGEIAASLVSWDYGRDVNDETPDPARRDTDPAPPSAA